MKKKAIHKTKVFTPTEGQRMQRLQAELDLGKDEIIANARKQLDAHDAMISKLLTDLRTAKEQQNLSLNDLQTRSGIDRAQLSRLFSQSAGTNPTLQTLERLAAACGKRVVLSLQDA
ncbi:MAG: helix-turn-helix transcriptional regulator [Fuerstia sp.]|nr:helix-turn-helix transcriptional regulator [Fuerstiella sp.]